MEAVRGCDGLFLVTEWNEFKNPDWDEIKKSMKSWEIFDGRNIWDPKKVASHGLRYHGIGRKA
jgi:UDPglucose 6-dehydrogenase